MNINKMIKLLLILFTIYNKTKQTNNSIDYTNPDNLDFEECACTRIELTTCGGNGKNYYSPCIAVCYGATVKKLNECTAEDILNVDYTKPENLDFEGCACTRNELITCGKNGKNYYSPCIALCYEAKVNHVNECTEEDIMNVDYTDPENLNFDACECTRNKLITCGKDGKNYYSPCIAVCLGKEIEEVGECENDSNQNDDSNAIVDYTNPDNLDFEGCACTRIELITCGKDGKNYYSPCIAVCNNAEIEGVGECENDSNQNDDDNNNMVIDYTNPDNLDFEGCSCTRIKLTTCGKDGNNYYSPCIALCLGKEIQGVGECENDSNQNDDDNNNNNMVIDYTNPDNLDFEGCACTRIKLTTCGKDGKNYYSPCIALCLGEEIQGVGECEKDSNQNDDNNENSENSKQESFENNDNENNTEKYKDKELCNCKKIYLPVCGLNGHTYSNECLANCENVKIVSKGPCKK